MFSLLKYNLIFLLLICFACKSSKNNSSSQDKSVSFLYNWWERYYPQESVNDMGIRLTHLEFFENGDARFHTIDANENNYAGTANGKWQYTDENKNLIDIYAWGEKTISLNIISLTKTNFIFTTPFAGNKDTIYMKATRK
jgi:hypothetical protein